MKKIRIKHIDPKLKSQRGLFDDGCMGASDCNDECCEWGCDVDLVTLKLIEKHRDGIEPLIGAKIEECFSTGLKKDGDYIGGAYRETAVRKSDKICAFHLIGKRGCSLFSLWAEKKAPKRIIPTICRIYPVTWHRGKLYIDTPLRKSCKCKEATPKGANAPSLLDTQKKEIRALFEIEGNGKDRKAKGLK